MLLSALSGDEACDLDATGVLSTESIKFFFQVFPMIRFQDYLYRLLSW
jgi:hypothetical protein